MNIFSVSEDVKEKLNTKEKIQFPIFVKMCYALFLLYFVIAIVLILLKNYIGSASVIAGTIFFGITLNSLKKGKIRSATWSALVGLVFGQIICMYLLDIGNNPYGIYRMAAFSVFLSLAQFLLSTRIREIIIFQVISVILLAGKIVLMIPIITPDQIGSFYASASVSFLVMIVSTILIILNYKMMGSLTAQVIKEKESVQDAFTQVADVVNESKKGLETGTVLSEKATSANTEVANIHTTFKDLKASSVNLLESATNITDAFIQMEKDAGVMKEDTASQNAAISESSAALTEIAANLSNMNEITSQRSKNMNSLITSLANQKRIIQEALNAVNDVKNSSADISDFVHTVEEIANQTGLLAMNASIEAAHAGSQGKGFAVIAQEIRKLSEETSKNSTHIAEVLTGNEKTVEKAADAVNSFASQVDQNTQELQETMQSLEGILMGISEMNIGTRSVMNSLQDIVQTSKRNGEVVEGVSSKISEQKEGMGGIKDFIEELEESIIKTDMKIDNIQELLTEIKTTSDQNVEMSDFVTKALENINI